MHSHERKLALLRNSQFFGNFSDEVLAALLPVLHTASYKAHASICLQGDPSNSLYIVDQGRVNVSVSSRDGKIIILSTLGEGDVFGEVGLFDTHPRTADVTAESDVTLYQLNNSDFDSVANLFTAEEWRSMASYVCNRFRDVIHNLEQSAFLDTETRILSKILDLGKKSDDFDGTSFSLNISQEQFGQMLGLSREATNKILSRIEKSGLIERKYKKIRIADIALLEKALNQDLAD